MITLSPHLTKMSSRKKRYSRKTKKDGTNDESSSSPLAVSLRWKTNAPRIKDDWCFFMDATNRSESFSFAGKVWHLRWKRTSNENAFSVELCQSIGAFPENLSFSAKTTVSTKNKHVTPSIQFVQVHEEPKVIFKKRAPAREESSLPGDDWTVECQLTCGQPGVGKIPVTILKNSEGYLQDYSLSLDLGFRNAPHLGDPLQDLPAHARNEVMPDVKLRCADGTVMAAHKDILTFRSQVFADMFRNGKAGRETEMVDVADLDAETLRSFLDYMYSGKLSDESMIATRSLRDAAVKYGVPELQKSCSNLLAGWLPWELPSPTEVHSQRDHLPPFLREYEDIFKSINSTKIEGENPGLAEKIEEYCPITNLENSVGVMQDYSLSLDLGFQELPNQSRSEGARDVKLRCADGTVMAAPRAILASRSEVFADMFRNAKAGRGTGIVDVPDLDRATLRSFLDYIYSGKVPDMSMEATRSLHDAAVKYGVLELQESCSDRLGGWLPWELASSAVTECARSVAFLRGFGDDDFPKIEGQNPGLDEQNGCWDEDVLNCTLSELSLSTPKRFQN